MDSIEPKGHEGFAASGSARVRLCPAVQMGETPPEAKPLKGFGGMGVLELIEDFRGDTYRAVYTVRFATKVYVLHVFQKKAKHGIATPKQEMDLIRDRLKRAESLYKGKN